jgi:transcriptional regulator with XRE-family HTH domain
MSKRLPNYLKTYRKRAGLSQDEVAFLLGCRNGAKVSRYERQARRPSMETVFAYRTMFGVPVRELFAGVYEKVAEETKQRARALAGKLNAAHPDRMTRRKLQCLRAMVSGAPEPDQYGLCPDK